jgi:hypothetical protein
MGLSLLIFPAGTAQPTARADFVHPETDRNPLSQIMSSAIHIVNLPVHWSL